MKSENQGWETALLSINSTIENAVQCLNISLMRIVLLIDKDGRLKGTVTDGDIRRGLLRGLSLASDVKLIANVEPLMVGIGADVRFVQDLMNINKIQQVPIIDEEYKVVGLHTSSNFLFSNIKSNRIVIMAGGEGKRLGPLTSKCPKPMLHISGKPILLHIIEKARSEGFINFTIAVNYLADTIMNFFGDGKNYSVNIDYVRETFPMGTAGALSLINNIQSGPFIVTNGDVVTDVKFSDFLEFHEQHNSFATMATREYVYTNQFGVVETQGVEIKGISEKPEIKSQINAGIYVLDREALQYIGINEKKDMPELFMNLIKYNKRVCGYPLHELWIDVGRPEDFLAANALKK